MRQIKELENNLCFEEIKEIYNRGNRLLVSFFKETLLGHIDTVGDISLKSLKDPFILKEGKIFAKEGRSFIIETVFLYKTSTVVVILPFEDRELPLYKRYTDRSVLADSISEVTI